MVNLDFSDNFKSKYPELYVPYSIVQNVRVSIEDNPKFAALLSDITRKIQNKFTLDNLKEDVLVRKYRGFFWQLNIDPTKIRPASEALIRRVLAKKPFPKISNLVDVYNIVSLETGIPLAAFDLSKISGRVLTLRFAKAGESFLGIAMKKNKILNGGEAVIADGERLVAIYPYRDCDFTKVTLETTKVIILLCGAPEVSLKTLEEAVKLATTRIIEFCCGEVLK